MRHDAAVLLVEAIARRAVGPVADPPGAHRGLEAADRVVPLSALQTMRDYLSDVPGITATQGNAAAQTVSRYVRQREQEVAARHRVARERHS